MKSRILSAFLIVVFASCTCKVKEQQRKNDFIKMINMEKEFLSNAGKGQVDYAKGREVVSLYNNFIQNYPKDTLVPHLYYKTGSMYLQFLGDLNESVKYFEILKEDYPKFEQTPVAIFTLGYIFNDRKKNSNKAKEYYKYLIDNYPNHFLTPEAKILYDNVGKTDEDLWNYIKEKSKDSINKAN